MFKIGDEVECTCGCGIKGTISPPDPAIATKGWTLTNAGGPMWIDERTIRLISTTPSFKVGDRVRHAKTGIEGSVHYLTATSIDVMWDTKGLLCGYEAYELVALNTQTESTSSAPAPTLSCRRCSEPNQYAEPNLPDGGYACYSCRKYHGYGCK